jgi:YfiH family protein
MIFFENLKNQIGLVHGVMERSDGSVNPFSNINSEKNILSSVGKISDFKYGIDNIIYAEQLHEGNIYIVNKSDSGIIKLNVDGLISNNPGQILVIKTADCVPILLFDPIQKVVAALHGGRKSLIAGIIPSAIQIMQDKFNSKSENILVGIGPHIRVHNYWLKEDTLNNLKNTKWKKYFITITNKTYFDLTALVVDQLLEAGIQRLNIEDSKICTYENAERFFSARKKEEEPDIYKKENDRFPCFGTFIGLEK